MTTEKKACPRWACTPVLDEAAVIAVGLALRVIALFYQPNINYPDEIFQTFEQAHRLAFGYGVKPWEFDVGLRSYVPAVLFAGLFKATAFFCDAPPVYVAVGRLFLAVCSLAPVAAMYGYGRRISRLHALIGGFVAASWFEIVYFSYRPLSEAMAFDFLLPGLCLAFGMDRTASSRKILLLGATLAAASFLRIQFLPCTLFLAYWAWKRGASGKLLAWGAAIPSAVFAVADWIAWGAPFYSLIANIGINLVLNKASHYGTQPPNYYGWLLFRYWSYAVWPIAAALTWRFKTYRVWIAAFLLLFLSHSLIAHKEYRFVFSAFAILALAASLATADLALWLRQRLPHRLRLAPLLAAVAFWGGISAALATTSAYRVNWVRSTPILRLQDRAFAMPDLCGFAIHDWDVFFSGGYTYLHRNVPIFEFPRRARALLRYAPAYNAIVIKAKDFPLLPPGYRPIACEPDPNRPAATENFCLMHRAGPCRREIVPFDVANQRHWNEGLRGYRIP